MNGKSRCCIGMIGAVLAGALLAGPASADYAGSLLDGGAVSSLSGRRGEEIVFHIRVEPGTDELIVATSEGDGDLDLYLSYADRPSPKDYDHRSAGKSTDEQIVVQHPRAGTWQLLVHGFGRFEGASLAVHARRGLIGQTQILSPAGGDRWQMGGEHIITSRAGPGVRNVRVQLSLDDGRTWLGGGLSVTVPAERGYLRLRLPDHRGGTYEARVRILDGDRGVVLDVSDRFTVAGRPIVLPRPRVIVVLPRLPDILRRLPTGHKPPKRIEPPKRIQPPRPGPQPKVVVPPTRQPRVDRKDERKVDRKDDRKVDRRVGRADQAGDRRGGRAPSAPAGGKESPRSGRSGRGRR